MTKILIVEDEKPISDLIRLSLRKNDRSCFCAFDGNSAADLIEKETFDLILLDVMIPGIDGFELMEYIHPMKIPVIFITARDAVPDRVRGLRMGAEDYIIKPFDVTELQARVDVVLRRYMKDVEHFQLNDLEIDVNARRVTKNGQEIFLTPKEFDLLLLFLQNPNVALYRERIYERIWHKEFEFGSKAVDLHIQRLRKKTGLENEIQTVTKVGYRLEVSQ